MENMAAVYLAWHEETERNDSASPSPTNPTAVRATAKGTANKTAKQKGDRATEQPHPTSIQESASPAPKLQDYDADLSYFYSGYFYF